MLGLQPAEEPGLCPQKVKSGWLDSKWIRDNTQLIIFSHSQQLRLTEILGCNYYCNYYFNTNQQLIKTLPPRWYSSATRLLNQNACHHIWVCAVDEGQEIIVRTPSYCQFCQFLIACLLLMVRAPIDLEKTRQRSSFPRGGRLQVQNETNIVRSGQCTDFICVTQYILVTRAGFPVGWGKGAHWGVVTR